MKQAWLGGAPLLAGTPAQPALEPEGWGWHPSGEAGGLDAGQAAHLIQTQLELI